MSAASATSGNLPASEEPRAAHVIEALCRVMRDLPSIEKGGTAAPQQGGYRYRGIEQITPHTQRLFAQHGVLFAPRVVGYQIRERIVSNKPWTDVIEEVEYDVYGPGGPTDKIVVGPILAIGRDSSDKGGNKCLTQAMKYALLQVFQVSDPADDADGTTHEADTHSTRATGRGSRRQQPDNDPLAGAEKAASKGQREAVQKAYDALTAEQQAAAQVWIEAEGLPAPERLTKAQADRALAHFLRLALPSGQPEEAKP